MYVHPSVTVRPSCQVAHMLITLLTSSFCFSLLWILLWILLWMLLNRLYRPAMINSSQGSVLGRSYSVGKQWNRSSSLFPSRREDNFCLGSYLSVSGSYLSEGRNRRFGLTTSLELDSRIEDSTNRRTASNS